MAEHTLTTAERTLTTAEHTLTTAKRILTAAEHILTTAEHALKWPDWALTPIEHGLGSALRAVNESSPALTLLYRAVGECECGVDAAALNLKADHHGQSICLFAEGRLLNLGRTTGHPSFVMSNSPAGGVLVWTAAMCRRFRSTRHVAS